MLAPPSLPASLTVKPSQGQAGKGGSLQAKRTRVSLALLLLTVRGVSESFVLTRLVWTELCPSTSCHVETLIPKMTILGDQVSKERVRVKHDRGWGPNVIELTFLPEEDDMPGSSPHVPQRGGHMRMQEEGDPLQARKGTSL